VRDSYRRAVGLDLLVMAMVETNVVDTAKAGMTAAVRSLPGAKVSCRDSYGHWIEDTVKAPYDVQVVDLCSVTVPELDDLWQYEVCLWRDRLRWDASGAFAALRRIIGRGGLPGKAVQAHGRTVGYTYYGLTGHLGVIAGLVVLPDWSRRDVGEMLLQNTIREMQRQGVSRIESRFVSVDCPWLGAALETAGFRTYWREFLHCELCPSRWPGPAPAMVTLEPWQETHLGEAAAILQAAYASGVEAEILALYHTVDGCRTVLDNILNQGSCGVLVPQASAMAAHRGQGLGFILVTEVALRQGHLPQIAVLPAYQRQGLGRGLLDYSIGQLAERGFESLSLIVSRANDRALKLYRAMGFQPMLTFPVGVWEG
jgi:ribosomal protein S18 acetylase RimI-like enzyme